ncbi:hypothetical protein EV182_002990, partial [Spiromyces aspiralis]
MPKRARSDGAAGLPNRRPRSSTVNSTGSNRASARVTGNIIDVGINDWSEFVRGKMLLVDKTHLLLDIMDDSNSDIIFRPRRFGKTMFLNMAYDFLNIAENEEELEEKMLTFKEMNIHKVDSTFIDEHCCRYPVIYLSLKDVRPATLDDFRDLMAEAVSTAIDEWMDAISDTSKLRLNFTRGRLNQKINNMNNSINDIVAIPKELVKYLSIYYNEKCIVLVDEFDTPVTSAPKEIREEVKRLMINLLSPLAKDNKKVRKFIMVGIDPINLNTLGSGLNNCSRYPLHEGVGRSAQDVSAYQFAFGFTEDEVWALVEKAVARLQLGTDHADKMMTIVRTWYNGYYACKDVRLYNPWSVMSHLKKTTTSRDECTRMIAQGSADWHWNDTDNWSFINSMYTKVRRANDLHELIQSLITSLPAHLGDGVHLDTIQRVRVRFSSCDDDNDDDNEVDNEVEDEINNQVEDEINIQIEGEVDNGVEDDSDDDDYDDDDSKDETYVDDGDSSEDSGSGSGGSTVGLAANLSRSGPTGTGTGNSSAIPVASAERTITIAKSVQG